MVTLVFSIDVMASREKVWETLWNDKSYRQWTAAFAEGSYAVSDWKEGSKIFFLTPKGDGIFSLIEKKVPGQLVVFRHLGEIKGGVEMPGDCGATESYELSGKNGSMHLEVALEAPSGFEAYFNKTFPEALKILKQLCEQ